MPRNWTSQQILSRSCSVHSHDHISRGIVAEAVDLNIIEWIAFPRTSKGERGLARWTRQIPYRGLSCRIEAFLAVAIQQKEEWAQVMLAHIQMRRESASSSIAAHQVAEELLLAKASAVYAATIL